MKATVKLTHSTNAAARNAELFDAPNTLRGCAGWLAGFWVVWMAILPLGHLTGLRTALALPVIGLAIALAHREAGWRAIFSVPALPFWLALLGWCALSSLWSPVPDITWSKFRFDLLIPFGAYLGGYFLARFTGAVKYLMLGPLIGVVLLAVLSVFVWAPVPAWVKTDVAFGTVLPMPYWYPGVGDASAYSVLLIGPLLAWWMFSRTKAGTMARWGPALFMLAVIGITVATSRRNALLVFLLVTPLFFVLLARAGKLWSRKIIGLMLAGFLLATAIVAGLFEFGARERLMPVERAALAPNTSAALMLMKNEPRPQIWAWYLDKAQQHPWIGVGFGRTVPAIAYKTESDLALAAIDPLAVIHAHNLALDWVLQTGLIGLSIFTTLLVISARRAWNARTQSREHRLLACAALVTIAAMLLRNVTDDFLVYGIATMFWATIGVLLGLLERQRPFKQMLCPYTLSGPVGLSSHHDVQPLPSNT